MVAGRKQNIVPFTQLLLEQQANIVSLASWRFTMSATPDRPLRWWVQFQNFLKLDALAENRMCKTDIARAQT